MQVAAQGRVRRDGWDTEVTCSPYRHWDRAMVVISAMAVFFLHESATGYALFQREEEEEIGTQVLVP